ncbi:MAG: hypothetical protein PVF57_10875 [Pseudomonadales bacterium]|jgi:hypothetical protein
MSPEDARVDDARRLMLEFAEATGLTGNAPPRRYLWTDAHAVCNYLTLADALGDGQFHRLAVTLAGQVHNVLGRHREDDARSGWISGLDEAEGRAHPTAGGLRIGKPLPERQRGAPIDERLEWDQDGQYYHYLTKWMHALLKLAQATGEGRYLDWAVELAVVAEARFRAPSGPPRLFWKMSIDLGRPLVPSSGHHDPLDGLVTALTLHVAGNAGQRERLEGIIERLAGLCGGGRWATDDPLGIGGLLFDAGRLAQLAPRSGNDAYAALLGDLLNAARVGLEVFAGAAPLTRPAEQRLAFRELGLGIGLHGVELMHRLSLPAGQTALLDALDRYAPLAERIERFWLEPDRQHARSWEAHRDINSVMLATSLAPAAFLTV